MWGGQSPLPSRLQRRSVPGSLFDIRKLRFGSGFPWDSGNSVLLSRLGIPLLFPNEIFPKDPGKILPALTPSGKDLFSPPSYLHFIFNWPKQIQWAALKRPWWFALPTSCTQPTHPLPSGCPGGLPALVSSRLSGQGCLFAQWLALAGMGGPSAAAGRGPLLWGREGGARAVGQASLGAEDSPSPSSPPPTASFGRGVLGKWLLSVGFLLW